MDCRARKASLEDSFDIIRYGFDSDFHGLYPSEVKLEFKILTLFDYFMIL